MNTITDLLKTKTTRAAILGLAASSLAFGFGEIQLGEWLNAVVLCVLAVTNRHAALKGGLTDEQAAG